MITFDGQVGQEKFTKDSVLNKNDSANKSQGWVCGSSGRAE
jgi:hypothetical protein